MSFDFKDIVYFGTIIVGALAAVFSDRWQNKQNQKDIEELKRASVSKDDYENDMNRIKEVNKLQWEKIDEGKKWESEHEKEASQRRLELELKVAAIDGNMAKLTEKLEVKLDDILRRVTEIEKDVKRGS